MARRTSTLLYHERGATAVEYGLIVSLVVVAMLGALSQFAGVTVNMWDTVENKVDTAHRR